MTGTIDMKDYERVGDGSINVSVAMYLPKAIRNEMKYKDLIELEKQMQAKIAELINDEMSISVSKIEQLLEAIFKDTIVKTDARMYAKG